MYKRLIERSVEMESLQAKLNVLYTLKGMGITPENLESLLQDLTRELTKVQKQVRDHVK